MRQSELAVVYESLFISGITSYLELSENCHHKMDQYNNSKL